MKQLLQESSLPLAFICCVRQCVAFTPLALATSIFVSSALGSPNANINTRYLDTLPPPDAPALFDTHFHQLGNALVRQLVGEVCEQLGRFPTAIEYVQADLNQPINRNAGAIARAGRLLGRAHAALGQQDLSVAALEAAQNVADTGELLVSAPSR